MSFMYENLAILSLFVFIYSISCGALNRTPVNGAIVFTVFGFAFGPSGFGLLNLDVDAEGLRTLAELTLALVLFTDAANANFDVLEHNVRIPRRLLLLGLPLTILLGFGIGIFVYKGLTLFEIAIIATMLAPTDAALGKAVVTDQSVPNNIRESLNMESGLNDGICIPILFVFLALAGETGIGVNPSIFALQLVAKEIGIGLGTGVGLTIPASMIVIVFANRGWIPETWRQLPVPALAVTCFAAAQLLGGSGFIASFCGGLLFGRLVKNHKHELLLAAEGTGDTLALITWVAFGAGVVGKALGAFTWEAILYSLLSLTVVRMLPVFVVLSGLNLRTDEKLFMGWFGPRGLASIVFGVIVLNEHLPGEDTIIITAVCTIILSILAHGLSANPLVAALARRLEVSAKIAGKRSNS